MLNNKTDAAITRKGKQEAMGGSYPVESLKDTPCQALLMVQSGKCVKSSTSASSQAKYFLRFKMLGSSELFQSDEVPGL